MSWASLACTGAARGNRCSVRLFLAVLVQDTRGSGRQSYRVHTTPASWVWSGYQMRPSYMAPSSCASCIRGAEYSCLLTSRIEATLQHPPTYYIRSMHHAKYQPSFDLGPLTSHAASQSSPVVCTRLIPYPRGVHTASTSNSQRWGLPRQSEPGSRSIPVAPTDCTPLAGPPSNFARPRQAWMVWEGCNIAKYHWRDCFLPSPIRKPQWSVHRL